jgi:hypothetical protein
MARPADPRVFRNYKDIVVYETVVNGGQVNRNSGKKNQKCASTQMPEIVGTDTIGQYFFQ